jgi:hypothetical protein
MIPCFMTIGRAHTVRVNVPENSIERRLGPSSIAGYVENLRYLAAQEPANYTKRGRRLSFQAAGCADLRRRGFRWARITERIFCIVVLRPLRLAGSGAINVALGMGREVVSGGSLAA